MIEPSVRTEPTGTTGSFGGVSGMLSDTETVAIRTRTLWMEDEVVAARRRWATHNGR